MIESITKRDLVDTLVRWNVDGTRLVVFHQSAGETCRVAFAGSLEGDSERMLFVAGADQSPASVAVSPRDIRAVKRIRLDSGEGLDSVPVQAQEIVGALIADIALIGFELADGGMLAVMELTPGDEFALGGHFSSCRRAARGYADSILLSASELVIWFSEKCRAGTQLASMDALTPRIERVKVHTLTQNQAMFKKSGARDTRG